MFRWWDVRFPLLFLFLVNSLAVAQKFFCTNGSSLEAAKFCDGVQDCDGSDEKNVSCLQCSTMEISCTPTSSRYTCSLQRDYICNGTITCQGLTPCDVGCPTHYKCLSGNKCVLRSTVCDGAACNGCPEDDDGWKNGAGFKCFRNGEICRLPQQLLWDSVQDCDDGSDLCYTSDSSIVDGRDIRNRSGVVFNAQKCTTCLNNTMLVPRQRVCDGIIDCSDLSDECLCEKQVADICKHVQLRTDKTEICPAGTVRCEISDFNLTLCTQRTSVCNGVAECSWNNLDEKYSYCGGTLPCSAGLLDDVGTECRCTATKCSIHNPNKGVRSGVLCDSVEDCKVVEPGLLLIGQWSYPPGFPEDECEAKCPNVTGKFNCTQRAAHGVSIPQYTFLCKVKFPGSSFVGELIADNTMKCDGILTCTFDNSDEKDCPNRFVCQSGNLVNIPKTKVCDGYKDCDNGSDESKTQCQNADRFYCASLNGRKVSVSKQVVCDFNINCDKGEDEMNCSSVDGRFYCENGKPFFVHKSRILDGRGDCSDWSDECSDKFKTSATILSSRYELIADPFLRAIVWIMALLAFFGNSIVIVGESKALKKIFSKSQGAPLRTNHMLVLNLAVADFLMSIYLFMLGIAGAVYSGSYCSQSLSWLTSQSCVAMGVLVVLSSETSVLTMLLLTGSRLFAVYNPIASLTKPSFRVVLLMIAVTWAISITLALVPLSTYYQSSFVERAMIESSPYFSNVVVNFTSAKNFTLKLLTYSKQLAVQPDTLIQQVQSMSSWNQLNDFFASHSDGSKLLKISSQFGYYSVNSVCIPNLFVTEKDGSWRFSLTISIINFLVFVFVASTYIAIIMKARRSVNKSHGVGKKSLALERKIIRLIITDFCCWIPLSIMVFVNFSGVKINSISYAVAAIVLLPINSALNPILYSDFIDKIYEKLRSRRGVESHSSGPVASTSVSTNNQNVRLRSMQ